MTLVNLTYRELDRLELGIVENDRQYPFIAIRARTGDLDAFCKDNATDLGRVFTGNYEDEEPRYLDQYVNAENNISRRRYERLYVRWTDALAVYSDSVDESEYEKTLFRAVLLFENCIILRRLLWSLEASRLLATTYKSFGIPDRFEATNRGCNVMEKRFHWAKTQLFVSIGVATYLLDKFKLFELIARKLHLGG
ncbi:MAG: hypothetical protein ACLPHI_03655 [Terriglobales bacterium]